MIKEIYILRETAKLAKEKGFDDFSDDNNRVYCELKDSIFYHKVVQQNYSDKWNENYLYRAPTQSLLQKWLRDVHNIYINIKSYSITVNNSTEYYHIVSVGSFKEEFKFYEEALEIGLQQGLKLI